MPSRADKIRRYVVSVIGMFIGSGAIVIFFCLQSSCTLYGAMFRFLLAVFIAATLLTSIEFFYKRRSNARQKER